MYVARSYVVAIVTYSLMLKHGLHISYLGPLCLWQKKSCNHIWLKGAYLQNKNIFNYSISQLHVSHLVSYCIAFSTILHILINTY